jgi:hypothetical protein
MIISPFWLLGLQTFSFCGKIKGKYHQSTLYAPINVERQTSRNKFHFQHHKY